MSMVIEHLPLPPCFHSPSNVKPLSPSPFRRSHGHIIYVLISVAEVECWQVGQMTHVDFIKKKLHV
ncbi:hypothetical protein BRARA_I02527 [Brassica rapa]|uniref:Uncharacterized protein n=2 Tax=Brassica campestris TaxID=3711 RepID=A0A397XWU2_BRACM|nr:hypothetical protein BRARA_I02527 [Brassica rapa]